MVRTIRIKTEEEILAQKLRNKESCRKSYLKFKLENPERYKQLQRNFYEKHKTRRKAKALGYYHYKRKCRELRNINVNIFM